MAEKKKSGSKTDTKKSEKKSQVKLEKPIKAGSRVKDEIWAIIILAVGVFLAIAMLSDMAGKVGELIAVFLKGSFGWVAFVLPFYMIAYGVLMLAKMTSHIGGRSVFFSVLMFLMIVLMNAGRFIEAGNVRVGLQCITDAYAAGTASGGVFGMFVGGWIVKAIGISGLYIFSIAVMLISLLLVVNTPISAFLDNHRAKRAEKQKQRLLEAAERANRENAEAEVQDGLEPKSDSLSRQEPSIRVNGEDKHSGYTPGGMSENQRKIMKYVNDDTLFKSGSTQETAEEQTKPQRKNPEAEAGSGSGYGLSDEPVEAEISDYRSNPSAGRGRRKAADAAAASLDPDELNYSSYDKYKLPPLTLLNTKSADVSGSSTATLKSKAAKLEETLRNFNVDAKVVQVTQGPAVTRYELQPAVGVKVSSIVKLSDDIALNMEAKSLRIEAPIPGKAAVGIEIENDKISMVGIKEVISSAEFKEHPSKISFAVGRDIAGNAIVGDLAEMPHLLIAGSTGSGKSVCINSIITSFLYKAKPDEVKLILVDPKVVELSVYDGIPHLLIPVVTDPTKAAAALNWAVAEMNERYNKFNECSTRDLKSYNEYMVEIGETDKVMPRIVIVIDELADLMMAAPSQVEDSICRLAQKARAAGMHLIVATQRPSVDVITGVIKANIASRIAFAVSSQIDSRTILDGAGAEKLVGKGDMLYRPQGKKELRVQGNFISDAEVHNVIKFVKEQAGEVEYNDDVVQSLERIGTPEAPEDMTDELLPDAIETVVKAGQASVSMLQRRFRIGYNRAARIVDMMEARGIIGPADGARPRQVLISEVDLYSIPDEEQDE